MANNQHSVVVFDFVRLPDGERRWLWVIININIGPNHLEIM